MRLIGFAIYLGIGAMLHALFVGAQFDWASAWTFGWLFGWPIMLFIAGWSVILLLVVIGVAIAIAWTWIDTIAQSLARRRRHAQRVR